MCIAERKERDTARTQLKFTDVYGRIDHVSKGRPLYREKKFRQVEA